MKCLLALKVSVDKWSMDLINTIYKNKTVTKIVIYDKDIDTNNFLIKKIMKQSLLIIITAFTITDNLFHSHFYLFHYQIHHF